MSHEFVRNLPFATAGCATSRVITEMVKPWLVVPLQVADPRTNQGTYHLRIRSGYTSEYQEPPRSMQPMAQLMWDATMVTLKLREAMVNHQLCTKIITSSSTCYSNIKNLWFVHSNCRTMNSSALPWEIPRRATGDSPAQQPQRHATPTAH